MASSRHTILILLSLNLDKFPFCISFLIAISLGMEATHRLFQKFEPEYKGLKILRNHTAFSKVSVPGFLIPKRLLRIENPLVVSSPFMESPRIPLRLGLIKRRSGIGWRKNLSNQSLEPACGRLDTIRVGMMIFLST